MMAFGMTWLQITGVALLAPFPILCLWGAYQWLAVIWMEARSEARLFMACIAAFLLGLGILGWQAQ